MKLAIAYLLLSFSFICGSAWADAYADVEVTDNGNNTVTVDTVSFGTSAQITVYFVDADGLPIYVYVGWVAPIGMDAETFNIPARCVRVRATLVVEDEVTYTEAMDRDGIEV